MSNTDASALFRKESMEARVATGYGSVQLSQDISTWAGSAFSLLLIITVFCFLFFGTYTKHAHITGVTVPAAGHLVITSGAAGRVEKVFVSENTFILRGEKIAQIDNTRDSSAGDVSDLVEKRLADRANMLRQELRLARDKHKEKYDLISVQLKGIDWQLQQLNHETKILERRLALANDTSRAYSKLQNEGFMSSLQAQQKADDLLDLESKVSAAARSELELRNNLRTLLTQRGSLGSALESEALQINRAISSVEQEIIENRGRKTTFVLAPRDGIVSTLSVQLGQSVQANQPVATLLPVDKHDGCVAGGGLQRDRFESCKISEPVLEVHLFAPSRTAGFVSRGQEVNLRFDAFPYQKFGLQKGVVTDVSRSALSPTELPSTLAPGVFSRARSLNGNEGEGLYRIRVHMKKQSILLYGDERLLKAGMMLDADIALDRRQIVERLFEPLLAIPQHPSNLMASAA